MASTEDEIEAVLSLEKETDRGAAIMASTFVENRLSMALRANFREEDDAREALGQIFSMGVNAPLSGFSAKINLGYLMRLYNKTVMKDLHLLRRIRNRFAHSMEVLSFASNEIKQLCANLVIIDHYVLPPHKPEEWPRYVWQSRHAFRANATPAFDTYPFAAIRNVRIKTQSTETSRSRRLHDWTARARRPAGMAYWAGRQVRHSPARSTHRARIRPPISGADDGHWRMSR
jgi:hypothetical protein